MNRLFLAAAVAVLFTGIASAAELTEAQVDWKANIKQCLIDADPDITLIGDRPDAYLTKTLRLRCLPEYGDICTACTDQFGATPGEDRVDW